MNLEAQFFADDCDHIRYLLRTPKMNRLRALKWCGISLLGIVKEPKAFFHASILKAGTYSSGHGFTRLVQPMNVELAPSVSAPTVWFLPELPSRSIISNSPIALMLESSSAFISSEFKKVRHMMQAHPDSDETIISGSWQSLFLIDGNGVANREIKSSLWQTFQLLDKIPVCRNFGFVFFASIEAGTEFVRHTGSSNVRLRHQLCVEIATDTEAVLEIDGVLHSWSLGRCIAFDDSFPHSVSHYRGGRRVVMAVDTWHPSLAQDEIAVLSDPVFSRFGKLRTPRLEAQ